jgi:peptidoglycan hydrolase-like protein with peptidoglycan-binding domain
VALAVLASLAACRGAPEPLSAAAESPSPAAAFSPMPSPSLPALSPLPSSSPSPSASPSTTPASHLPIKRGASGADVLSLQQRLTDLGYWLGKPDGRFGGTTQQAVYALQKAAGLPRTGVVNAATEAALVAGTRPKARSTSGRLIEVNIARNLLLFVNDGHVEYILNTSTGGGYVYYDQGVREVAVTPKGKFHTYRVIDGPRQSTLGLLIRPRYFTGGYAIHGDGSVPAYPASHGCVRVSNAAIDWIWASNLDPIGTTVWIY